MFVRLANVIYWLAAAASVALIAAAAFGWANGRGDESMQIGAIVLAFLIFAAGRAVLYVFADQ